MLLYVLCTCMVKYVKSVDTLEHLRCAHVILSLSLLARLFCIQWMLIWLANHFSYTWNNVYLLGYELTIFLITKTTVFMCVFFLVFDDEDNFNFLSLFLLYIYLYKRTCSTHMRVLFLAVASFLIAIVTFAAACNWCIPYIVVTVFRTVVGAVTVLLHRRCHP